jgi:hypothetical protein
MGEGGGGRGTESYDGKKAWSSINHSILGASNGATDLFLMRDYSP